MTIAQLCADFSPLERIERTQNVNLLYYNIDWIQNPPPKKVSPRQGALDAVDHVETPDPLTAKIVLKRPNPSLIPNLASEYLGIGSKIDLANAGGAGRPPNSRAGESPNHPSFDTLTMALAPRRTSWRTSGGECQWVFARGRISG